MLTLRAMLSLTNIALRRGPRVLFRDVSLQVHAGQRLGVVGANGTGKSSLFAMLRGQLEADAGEWSLPGQYQIAHLAQETATSGGTALAFVMAGDQRLRQLQSAIEQAEHKGDGQRLARLHGEFDAIGGYHAEARAGRLLHGLGFAADAGARPVDTFSGGWRMRLNLARALMCHSDLLLLDEPTNHLDLPAIVWLEEWLQRYPGILLLISHDRDFLDGVCTHIAQLQHQRIDTYTGNYSEFERTRAERMAQQQKLHEKQQRERRHIQSFVDRFRAKASKARQAQSRLKMLERMGDTAAAHAESPFSFHFTPAERPPGHLLNLEQAGVGYEGQTVVSGINLSLIGGDRIGLLGANGAGKSTLVKAIADGSTLLTGRRMTSKDCRIGYFAQHQLEQLERDSSPYQTLRRQSPQESEQTLRDYLGSFGFQGERIFEPIGPLSGGEKARLVLALIVQRQPSLLLLDEPTNHLDLDMRHALELALNEFDGALMVISHDRHLIRSVCDRLLIVRDGQVNDYQGDLEAYAEALRRRQAEPLSDAGADNGNDRQPAPGRRQQRQQAAQQRKALQPQRQRARQLEQRLSTLHERLTEVRQALADPALYESGDPENAARLAQEDGELRNEIDRLETEWLEAQEVLERAGAV